MIPVWGEYYITYTINLKPSSFYEKHLILLDIFNTDIVMDDYAGTVYGKLTS